MTNKSPYRRKPGSKARHGHNPSKLELPMVWIRPDSRDATKDYEMPKAEAMKLVAQGKLIELVDAGGYGPTEHFPKGD